MGEIKILLGFEVGTGNEVYMGLHHTVITGMTQLIWQDHDHSRL